MAAQGEPPVAALAAACAAHFHGVAFAVAAPRARVVGLRAPPGTADAQLGFLTMPQELLLLLVCSSLPSDTLKSLRLVCSRLRVLGGSLVRRIVLRKNKIDAALAPAAAAAFPNATIELAIEHESDAQTVAEQCMAVAAWAKSLTVRADRNTAWSLAAAEWDQVLSSVLEQPRPPAELHWRAPLGLRGALQLRRSSPQLESLHLKLGSAEAAQAAQLLQGLQQLTLEPDGDEPGLSFLQRAGQVGAECCMAGFPARQGLPSLCAGWQPMLGLVIGACSSAARRCCRLSPASSSWASRCQTTQERSPAASSAWTSTAAACRMWTAGSLRGSCT
jgi:hypothetical protein